MEEERDKAWNRFTSTGRVSDYLAYVADRESYRYGDCGSKEEKIVETAKRTDRLHSQAPFPSEDFSFLTFLYIPLEYYL